MESLFAVLALVFLVLAVVGLVKPSKGAFWLLFLPTKTRLIAFFANIVACIIFASLMNAVSPVDYYSKGQESLQAKRYDEAIQHFEHISGRDQHAAEKTQLIRAVRAEAESFYAQRIVDAVTSLDNRVVDSLYTLLVKYEPQPSLSRDSIAVMLAAEIAGRKAVLAQAEKKKDYPAIVQAARALLVVPEEREAAQAKVAKYEEIARQAEIAAIKSAVQGYAKKNQYREALTRLAALRKYPSESEYVRTWKDKLEQKRAAFEIAEYKRQARRPTYGQLLRSPDGWKNVAITFRGEIFQKMEGGFMIMTSYTSYGGYSGDLVLVKSDKTNIIEGDVVEVVGPCLGAHSYKTVFGAENTVPFMQERYVTVLRERQ